MQKRFSYTGELIKYQNSIEIESINFLRHHLTRTYFKNLKKLIIFNMNYDLKPLEIGSLHRFSIDHFQSLQQLELDGIRLTKRTSLNLSNLKTLTLKNFEIYKQFELNCPVLENFICYTVLNRISIKYPQSIRTMQLYNHQRDCKLDYRFENLELLDIYDINGYFSDQFLSKLPKLKQLVIYSHITKQDFKSLKRQKKIYDLDHLKILYFGFDDDLDFFGNDFVLHYFFNNMLNKDALKHVVENYSKLNYKSFWPVMIQYDQLIQSFGIIPNDFFEKFINLREIKISNFDLIDSYRRLNLINFLKRSGFIEFLTIENCTMNQQFLNQLPYCTSMITLQFINQSNLTKFDYEFLKSLNAISTSVNECNLLPIRLIDSVLELKNFKLFSFKHQETLFDIEIEKNKFILSMTGSKSFKKFKQKTDLIQFLKKIESIKIFIRC